MVHNSVESMPTPKLGSRPQPITARGNLQHRLRVLVLDEELPYPANSGKRIRTWNLLKRLAQRHSVTLLCYGADDDRGVAAVEASGIQVRLVRPQRFERRWRIYAQLLLNILSPYPFSVDKHYSKRFEAAFRRELETAHWDLVHCEWTPYARYASQVRTVPVVIGAHNIESDIWQRRARNTGNFLARAFFWTQEYKMRRFERNALLRATAVTAVTEKDLETMHRWGVASASLAPNGINSETQPYDQENDDEILFLASLDWHANVDSLEYFITKILPLVLQRNPRARLTVVGRQPAPSLIKRYSRVPGVDFVGEVPDPEPFLKRAALVVVPLRIGGGSRIKILEALACAKAVISTSIGAEGLDVVSGEHLMVADAPQEFADSILRLQESSNLRNHLGQNGRRLVAEKYTWDRIATLVETTWVAAVSQQDGSDRRNMPWGPL